MEKHISFIKSTYDEYIGELLSSVSNLKTHIAHILNSTSKRNYYKQQTIKKLIEPFTNEIIYPNLHLRYPFIEIWPGRELDLSKLDSNPELYELEYPVMYKKPYIPEYSRFIISPKLKEKYHLRSICRECKNNKLVPHTQIHKVINFAHYWLQNGILTKDEVDQVKIRDRIIHEKYGKEIKPVPPPMPPKDITSNIKASDRDQRIKLKDMYVNELDEFDWTRLKGNDLLDNIFFLYIVKKAQSGDVKAYNKLHKLYAPAISRIVNEFSKIYETELDIKGKSREDIESESEEIFKSLIMGDNPNIVPELISILDSSKLATRKIREMVFWKICFDVPIRVVATLLVLGNTRDKYLTLMNGKTDDELEIIIESAFSKLMFFKEDVRYTLNPNLWFTIDSKLIGFRKDTHKVLKSPLQYNTDCFRPSPETNFSEWLTGKSRGRQYGALWKRLHDRYKKGLPHIPADLRDNSEEDVHSKKVKRRRFLKTDDEDSENDSRKQYKRAKSKDAYNDENLQSITGDDIAGIHREKINKVYKDSDLTELEEKVFDLFIGEGMIFPRKNRHTVKLL